MVLHDGIGELTRARSMSVAIGINVKFACASQAKAITGISVTDYSAGYFSVIHGA